MSEKDFLRQMADFVIPGDEGLAERLRSAREEFPEADSDDEAVIALADDDFVASEIEAFWAMVRKAREIVGGAS